MRGLMRSIIDPIREKKIKKAYDNLLNEDIRKVSGSMRTLRKTNHPLSLIACVNLLKNNLPEVRSEAVEIIGFRKDSIKGNNKLRDEVHKRLEKLLSSKKEHVRESAVKTIGKLDDPEFAIPQIKRILESEKSNEVLIKIIDVLGTYKYGNNEARQILANMLSNPDFIRYQTDITNALQRNSVI